MNFIKTEIIRLHNLGHQTAVTNGNNLSTVENAGKPRRSYLRMIIFLFSGRLALGKSGYNNDNRALYDRNGSQARYKWGGDEVATREAIYVSGEIHEMT